MLEILQAKWGELKKNPKQNLKSVFDYIILEEYPTKLAPVYRSVQSNPYRIQTKMFIQSIVYNQQILQFTPSFSLHPRSLFLHPPPVVSSNVYPNEIQENINAFFTEIDIMDILQVYYIIRKQLSRQGRGVEVE